MVGGIFDVRRGRTAVATWKQVAEMGWAGIVVPEEFGGVDMGFLTFGVVAEELGRHCGSTALTFNMHTATCLLAGPIADELALTGDDRFVVAEELGSNRFVERIRLRPPELALIRARAAELVEGADLDE